MTRNPGWRELAQLYEDVRSDLDRLRRLMRGWGVAPDRRLEMVMVLGELLGRADQQQQLQQIHHTVAAKVFGAEVGTT